MIKNQNLAGLHAEQDVLQLKKDPQLPQSFLLHKTTTKYI